MAEVISLPEGSARLLRRPRRAEVSVSAYGRALKDYKHCLDVLVRECLALVHLKREEPQCSIDAALGAQVMFFGQTPVFTQAWVSSGGDLIAVTHLVRANAHAAHLRTALEQLRPPAVFYESHATEVLRLVEVICTFVEGVVDTPIPTEAAR
jgi:hypothetical protein